MNTANNKVIIILLSFLLIIPALAFSHHQSAFSSNHNKHLQKKKFPISTPQYDSRFPNSYNRSYKYNSRYPDSYSNHQHKKNYNSYSGHHKKHYTGNYKKHYNNYRRNSGYDYNPYRNYYRGHYYSRPGYSYGHTISALPFGYITLSLGGLNYYYHSGKYYRPYGSHFISIRAPLGLSIRKLPYGYKTVYYDNRRYYLVEDDYYSWDSRSRTYTVVNNPDPGTGTALNNSEIITDELFVYPKRGQSKEQTSRDKYECYLWAVNETDYDPAQAYTTDDQQTILNYRRASSACLEARGYTVK